MKSYSLQLPSNFSCPIHIRNLLTRLIRSEDLTNFAILPINSVEKRLSKSLLVMGECNSHSIMTMRIRKMLSIKITNYLSAPNSISPALQKDAVFRNIKLSSLN